MNHTEATVTAGSIMTDAVITVTEDTSVAEAIDALTRHSVSGLPVVGADGIMVGVVTEYDLMCVYRSDSVNPPLVADLMTRDVETVDEDATLDAVADKIQNLEVRRLPVTRGGRLVGIISRRDLIREVGRLHNSDPLRYDSLLQEILARA